MIKTLIIDDEAKARRIMRQLLTEYCAGIEIIGEAGNVYEGQKQIKELHPDLVFLDIEMPEHTGFKLFDFFTNVDFHVVFCTAYAEYAIKAFEVSAIDYLLKPIQIDQLIHACEKVEKRIKSSQFIDYEKMLVDLQKSKKIALPSGEGLTFLNPNDIVFLQAEGSYTRVILNGREDLLISKKIKDIEELLSDHVFFRSHRSFVVNINHIQSYVRKDGGYLLMSNGKIASLSSSNREAFLALWGNN